MAPLTGGPPTSPPNPTTPAGHSRRPPRHRLGDGTRSMPAAPELVAHFLDPARPGACRREWSSACARSRSATAPIRVAVIGDVRGREFGRSTSSAFLIGQAARSMARYAGAHRTGERRPDRGLPAAPPGRAARRALAAKDGTEVDGRAGHSIDHRGRDPHRRRRCTSSRPSAAPDQGCGGASSRSSWSPTRACGGVNMPRSPPARSTSTGGGSRSTAKSSSCAPACANRFPRAGAGGSPCTRPPHPAGRPRRHGATPPRRTR